MGDKVTIPFKVRRDGFTILSEHETRDAADEHAAQLNDEASELGHYCVYVVTEDPAADGAI